MFGLLVVLFAIGTAIIAGGKKSSATVRDVFREQVGHAMNKTTETVFAELDVAKANITQLNDRIEYLEEKLIRDGKLCSSDDDELYSVRSYRTVQLQKWGTLNVERVGMESQGQQRELIPIRDQTLHIAEGHVGMTSLNRRCSICRRFLVLRRNRQQETSLASFFWGCPGYFDAPSQRHAFSERFHVDDLKLLADLSIEDWQTPRRDLDRAVKLMGPDIDHRLSEHVQEEINQVICGTHAEALILSKRKEPAPLLELYHLSCPRPSCEYRVKISSIGQLTSLLTAREGRGLL